MEALDAKDILASLLTFQQQGHLCDATLRSTDGLQFVAHAGVLAAASPLLERHLLDCECGDYTIVTSLACHDILNFIHFSYTGECLVPHSGSLLDSGLINMSTYETEEHFCRNVLDRILQFADRGLFCDTVLHIREGGMQTSQSYLLATRYGFLSHCIRTGSFVSVTLSEHMSSNTRHWVSVGSTLCDAGTVLNPNVHSAGADNEQLVFAHRSNDPIPQASTASHSNLNIQLSGDNLYVCPVCQKPFKYKSRLLSHLRNHTGDKSHICDTCQKGFNSASHLRSHQRVHSDVKPFTCSMCDKGFRRAEHLKVHQNVHFNDKPHECAICQKRFSQLKSLKEHQRVHTEEKPYTCSVCNKKFRWAGDLNRHQRIHTNVKPYVCHVCYKEFKQSAHLKDHQNSHDNQKLYGCDICEKRFNSAGTLRKHKGTHTSGTPFVCDRCGTAFKRADNLKRHQLTHKKPLEEEDV